MTPADKRMMELLEKWLASLDLHLQYAELPEADYLAAQPWPKHDRPTRWIIELARQKTLELKGQQESRISAGDSRFAESLELMGFLANLVGSQHVQRFIPLADPDKDQAQKASASSAKKPTDPATTAIQATNRARPSQTPLVAEVEATREMPKVSASTTPARRAQEPAVTAKAATTPKTAAKAVRKAPAAGGSSSKVTSPALQKKVMADAVRLLNWGKEWHELADLIARIADRPPVAEVRRILRSHKAEIELQAESDED